MSQTATDDLNENERAGLELIKSTGGIHQSDFWKELDVSSRTGSRIVTSLLESGYIEREESVYNGQNTYYLKPHAKELDFTLLMAGDIFSPFVGEEQIDSQSGAFTQWVMQLER